ncbi:MAG: hypothetical protein EBY45_07655 [Gammaproteobacteria bacterium]|jgi:hypothetical protein|nr:hypothetical protein [Gammaproteobacteria bacterium]
MIMSYLLSRIFPWVVELGLWFAMVAGGVMGYQSEYLDSRILATLLGAGIGFIAGVFPFGLLQVLVRNNQLLEMMIKEGYGRPRLSLHKGQVVEMPYVGSEDRL